MCDDPHVFFPAAPAPCQLAVVVALGLGGCAKDGPPSPDPAGLRQPSGVGLSPSGNFLLVSNGNWAFGRAEGSVVALSLAKLGGILEVLRAGAQPPDCEREAGEGGEPSVLRCPAEQIISEDSTIFVGSGVASMDFDGPWVGGSSERVLITVRSPASVVWADLRESAGGLRLECGQGEARLCDQTHIVDVLSSNSSVGMPRDPARVVVDREGFRFAYVPHLLGGSLSMIALDGPDGPELTDIERDFYREDPYSENGLAGGFAVAQRRCDETENPPSTRDCERPLLLSSQRFWPGIRAFTVAPGLDVVIPGSTNAVLGLNPEVVSDRPGDDLASLL